MQKTCARCGASNPTLASFCRQCGERLTDLALRAVIAVTPLVERWRSLRRQMTRREVRKLLGEPAKIESMPDAGAAGTAADADHGSSSGRPDGGPASGPLTGGPASGQSVGGPASGRSSGGERWIYLYDCPGAPAVRLAATVEFEPPDGLVAAWTEPDWEALTRGGQSA